MKLLLEDLIRDKYYRCNHLGINKTVYYKFEKYEDEYLYFYDFEIYDIKGTLSYIKSSESSCTIHWFNECFIFEEIDPLIIVDGLPDKHPDKQFFLRKRKLQNFLKL